MKTYYTTFIVYHSGKVVPVILILLFFSFILYMPTRLFLSDANKASFKSKNSVGRKCCQLKVLKVLLMHLFVTLLINKTTGSDNRHFFFNTLGKENQEKFLTYGTFCTHEQIEKEILRKRLSQDTLSKVHLYKYGSCFKFILLLSGNINLNPGPTAPRRNDILWQLLHFQNCSFSTELFHVFFSYIFIEIFLPKSKPVLIGTSYRPPDKYDLVNYLERTFSDTNVFESQECYLLGDININLQAKDKEIFRHKLANTTNKR